MLIIWGKKRVEREAGKVADFCPFCRRVQAFRLVSVSMVPHLYYVPLGGGEVVGHVARCSDCGAEIGVDPDRYERSDDAGVRDLNTLIAGTQPRLPESLAERLKLEESIRRSPYTLSSEQREALVLEPFAWLNPVVERRFKGSTHIDAASSLGCLGTVFVAGALTFAATRMTGDGQDVVAFAALIAGVVGVLYTLVQLHREPLRFVRRSVLPKLVSALAPLKPLPEEIAHTLDLCRRNRWKIGKAVRADDLRAMLEKATSS